MAMGAIGGGLISGASEAGFAALAAKKAFSRQKKILKNRIQWQVNDMRSAGINPLLAVTSGFGGGGAANVAMAATPSFGRTFSGTAKDLSKLSPERQIAIANAETAQNNAETSSHNVLKVGAESHKAETDALIAIETLTDKRNKLVSGNEIAAFDKTPHGKYLIRVNRGMEPVSKVLGGIAAGAFGASQLFRGRSSTRSIGRGGSTTRRSTAPPPNFRTTNRR